GLTLSGWYFDPLVRGGNNFEPPYHARTSLTFYSKFWRVYRSGIFALRGELAMESWSTGTAGFDSSGTLRTLPGASFGEINLEIPFELAGIEGPMRERLRQVLERGHVTVSARWLEGPQVQGTVAVDLERARQVLAAAKELKKRLKLKGDVDLAFVARQSDVLTVQREGGGAETGHGCEVVAVVGGARGGGLGVRRAGG